MSVLPSGVLAISVDMESDPLRPMERRPSFDDFSGRLLALLVKYRAAATWGLADVGASVVAGWIMQAQAGHELAILGDASWVGSDAGRTRFSRELNRRLTLARAGGHEISAVMLRGIELGEHTDVLIKQGIMAIGNAGRLPAGWFRRRRIDNSPQAIRFGLWQIPASRRLTGTSDWLWSAGLKSRRGIDRAVRTKSVYHLAIDAAALAACGRSVLAAIEKILRHASRRRDEAALRMTTLSGAAALLMGDRRSMPARSILHPAA